MVLQAIGKQTKSLLNNHFPFLLPPTPVWQPQETTSSLCPLPLCITLCAKWRDRAGVLSLLKGGEGSCSEARAGVGA